MRPGLEREGVDVEARDPNGVEFRRESQVIVRLGGGFLGSQLLESLSLSFGSMRPERWTLNSGSASPVWRVQRGLT